MAMTLQSYVRISESSPAYPLQLRDLPHPPFLYVRGAIARDDALAVAIVGSRRATPYGLAVAERLAADLAARGVTIVSGLARGIDTAAHHGALDAGGRTIAVLGCGPDRVYPAENRALAERIAARGAVISQFGPGTPPLPHHFPERNKLIAGLALGTVVVEAAEASGALITAGLAADFGRLTFAIPGQITCELSRGTHSLLRDGATLVRDWTDIVDEFPAVWRECVRRDVAPVASREAAEGDQARVLELLSDEPQQIERFIELSGLGSGRTAAALLELEVKGWARQVPGQRYIRWR